MSKTSVTTVTSLPGTISLVYPDQSRVNYGQKQRVHGGTLYATGLMIACLVIVSPAASAQDVEHEPAPEAVVVAFGEVPGGADVLRAAEQSGPRADWSIEVIPTGSSLSHAPPPPEAQIQALWQHQVGADNLGCLEIARDLDVAVLLGQGHRDAASQVAALTAACAHANQDDSLARELLHNLVVAELAPSREILRGTTPAFQALLEEVRAEVHDQERTALTIRSHPEGASVIVNAGAHQCARTPCRVHVSRGSHVLVAELLGYQRRVEMREVNEGDTITLTLVPATAESARTQLGHAIMLDAADDPRLARAVSTAFGSRVALIIRTTTDDIRLALYDQVLDRVVSRATVGRPSELISAVRIVVADWQDAAFPEPRGGPPWAWITAGSVAAAALLSVGAYFLFRPGRTTVFVFPETGVE